MRNSIARRSPGIIAGVRLSSETGKMGIHSFAPIIMAALEGGDGRGRTAAV